MSCGGLGTCDAAGSIYSTFLLVISHAVCVCVSSSLPFHPRNPLISGERASLSLSLSPSLSPMGFSPLLSLAFLFGRLMWKCWGVRELARDTRGRRRGGGRVEFGAASYVAIGVLYSSFSCILVCTMRAITYASWTDISINVTQY